MKVGSCVKSTENLAGVKFFRGKPPLIFGLALKSWRICWSLCKISRRSVDGARRSCVWLKNKKTSRLKQKAFGTNVPGGLKNWQENCQMQTFTLWPRQHFPACFYNILQYLQSIVLGLLALWILQDCINARPCIRMLLQRRQHFLCHSLLLICTNRQTSKTKNISYEKHNILFANVLR